jgi:hypothetical protein
VERVPAVRRILFILLVTGAVLALVPAAVADHELVLVVAEDSPIAEVDALAMRKAYFGVSVNFGNGRIRPYLLAGDAQLNRIFMQSVIAMSERSYERRLLALTLKYGAPRPETVGSPEELIAALMANPMAIGYLWREDADRASGIRIVRTLWRAD